MYYSALRKESDFDKAILCSGDVDFVPVVKKLRKLDKEFEVWSFTEGPLSPLMEEELLSGSADPKLSPGKIVSINSLLRC